MPDPKPMTPERLAEIRSEVEEHDHHWSAQAALGDLLAEVDYWRLRSPVTAKDVARTGVTWAHAAAWTRARGEHVNHVESAMRNGAAADLIDHNLINACAGFFGWPKCRHDILDEMAAMEPCE